MSIIHRDLKADNVFVHKMKKSKHILKLGLYMRRMKLKKMLIKMFFVLFFVLKRRFWRSKRVAE